jgi:transcriptional regulator
MLLIWTRKLTNMLTENQKRVIALNAEGLSQADISNKTGLSRSTVNYALREGKKNVEDTIDTLEFLAKNRLLDDKQAVRLKAIANYL